jgi:hypothetical protein
MMGRKKMSDAARIRAYYEKNPGAKPMDVAKALNVKATNVYIARSKMKQAPRSRGMLHAHLPEATEKAKAWLAVNPWFGKDAKATATAVGIHQDLLAQGVVADSVEYFKLLDERIRVAAKVALAEKLGVQAPTADPVNHPPHYKTGGFETIDFIEAKELNYRLGNVIKYITRSDHKGNRKEDLQKALWYLQREIEKA